MGGVDLSAWIEECSTTGSLWYAKRLTGNDTLANGTHQAGPYIPKEVLFRALPALDRKDTLNPDIRFSLIIDSHAERRTVRAIWYNNRFHAGTRNETRLTGFGGASSALLDPESTGALVIFAFIPDGPIALCRIWVCRSEAEETLVEDHIGPVDPGAGRPLLPHPSDGFQPLISAPEIPGDCYLQPHALPPEWLEHFPSGLDIVRKTVELRPGRQRIPDLRLLRRRECEYQLFRSIEDAVELPIIKQGFTNVEEFARHANSLLQRRKSRSGRSLELHARIIFLEEGLREGSDFSYQPETEPGKRPDFVFPSADAYRDASFPRRAASHACGENYMQGSLAPDT